MVGDETVVDSYLPELDSRLDWMRSGGEEGKKKSRIKKEKIGWLTKEF